MSTGKANGPSQRISARHNWCCQNFILTYVRLQYLEKIKCEGTVSVLRWQAAGITDKGLKTEHRVRILYEVPHRPEHSGNY